MLHTSLSGLAVAVVLSTTAVAPAASGEAFQIISAGKSAVTPNRRGKSLPGSTVKKRAGKPPSPQKAWPSKIEVPSLIKERQ
jgi:hypothetical protein